MKIAGHTPCSIQSHDDIMARQGTRDAQGPGIGVLGKAEGRT